MLKLSFNQRRVIVGVVWFPTMIFLLNDVAGLGWFGGYDRYVTVASFALLAVAVLYIAPSISEMEERRAQRRRGTGATSE